jgi:DNA-binding winged helix-turn-helix (wHTH) protein
MEDALTAVLKEHRKGLTYRQQSQNVIKNLPRYGLKIEST